MLFLSAEDEFRQLWTGFPGVLDRSDRTKDQAFHVSTDFVHASYKEGKVYEKCILIESIEMFLKVWTKANLNVLNEAWGLSSFTYSCPAERFIDSSSRVSRIEC